MKSLLLLLVTAACFAKGVNMPTKRYSVSPDVRWQVRCVSDERDDGFSHRVFLSRLFSEEEVQIWSCDRSCDVLWSDDSQRLAIIDWTGSSLSEVYLVEISAPKARRLEVAGIANLVQKDELEGHCYYEALKWESAHRLTIRVFGHTDENPSHGFAYYLSVDTRSGEAKLVRKEDKEPNKALEPTP